MKKAALHTHKKFLKLDGDHKLSAKAASLNYVMDNKPGITRKKNGKGNVYFYSGKVVKDKISLDRIKCLAIPPLMVQRVDMSRSEWTYTGYRF